MEVWFKRVLMTGGSGFIGRALVPALLADGYDVHIISRHPKKTRQLFSQQVTTYPSMEEAFTTQHRLARFGESDAPGFGIVINLAGENIAHGRWSAAKKEALQTSRVDFSHALVNFCRRYPPHHFLQASASGYYGNQVQGPWSVMEEEAPHGQDFLAELCQAWESPARTLSEFGVQVSIMRFAMVLDREGGAWQMLRRPYRMHMGGIVGSGEQPFSWIHRQDLVRAVLFLLSAEAFREAEEKNMRADVQLVLEEYAKAEGRPPVSTPNLPVVTAYNFAAPEMLTQAQSVAEIHAYLGGHRATIRLPKLVTTLAMGNGLSQLAMGGQKLYPKALLAKGFMFKYDKLRKALPTLF